MSSRASAGCWFIDLVGIFRSSQSSNYLISDQLPPQTALAAGSINTGPPALSKSSLLIHWMVRFSFVVSVLLLLNK
jgi:hypothetical protein